MMMTMMLLLMMFMMTMASPKISFYESRRHDSPEQTIEKFCDPVNLEKNMPCHGENMTTGKKIKFPKQF